MHAYKFLAAGAVGPFTGFRWPLPGARDAWVAAPAGAREDRWIHACRPPDLPFWIGDELWAVELVSPVRDALHQVASPRARLLEHVAGWDAAAKRALAEACAWRARELASPHLAPAARAALGAARDLEALGAVAREAAGARRTAGERIADYVATAAHYGAAGVPSTAAFVTSTLAAEVGGGPAAADTERAWQARWLAARLRLE
jgi:hypothetical protein